MTKSLRQTDNYPRAHDTETDSKRHGAKMDKHEHDTMTHKRTCPDMTHRDRGHTWPNMKLCDREE